MLFFSVKFIIERRCWYFLDNFIKEPNLRKGSWESSGQALPSCSIPEVSNYGMHIFMLFVMKVVALTPVVNASVLCGIVLYRNNLL